MNFFPSHNSENENEAKRFVSSRRNVEDPYQFF